MSEKAYNKISILIPVYNKENFVVDTLRSITSNFVPDGVSCEIVIVDDCSTDNSVNSIKSFISSFKTQKSNDIFDFILVEEKQNRGPCGALNLALEQSTGDLIAITDADDLFTYNSISSRLQKFFSDPTVDWVTGNELTMQPNSTFIVGVEYLKECSWSSAKEYLDITLNGKNFIPAQSSMIKREVLQKLDFKWPIDLKATQDVWFNLFLLANNVFPTKIDEYVAIYRVPDHGQNSLLARSRKNGQMHIDFLQIAKYLKPLISENHYNLILKIANNFLN